MRILRGIGFILMIVGSVVGVSCYWSLADAFGKTATLYQTWEQDLADSLALQKSDAILLKVNQQARVLSPTITKIELSSNTEKQPNIIKSSTLDYLHVRQALPITYNLIPIGKMFVYHSVFEIAIQALLSPIFLFSLLIISAASFLYFNKQQKLQVEARQLKAEADFQAKLGQMARQVAHDIRSPLSALSAIASQMSQANDERARMIKLVADRVEGIAKELLRQTAKKQKNPELPSYGSTTVESESSLRSSKQNSIMESGLVEQNLEKVILSRKSILDLVAEYEVRYPTVAFITNIQLFDFRVSEEFKSNLDRMLSNLIQNSIDSFEASFSTSKRVFVQVSQKHDDLEINISDNGRGIPLSIQPKLFQKNFTAGKLEGNGLGLYSAKEFVEACGGSISLNSAEGLGTSIEILIPTAI